MTQRQTKKRQAYTLIEMLLVLAVMSVLIAIFAPLSGASVNDQLGSAAHVVASDINFTRDLAVTNGSSYTLTFNTATNSYQLQHSGSNTLLQVLPPTPFSVAGESPHQRTCRLNTLPGAHIELLGLANGGSVQQTATVEFTSLGAVQSGAAATVWLAAGHGDTRRYVSVTVNPVLGTATAGEITRQAPPGVESGSHNVPGDGIGSSSW